MSLVRTKNPTGVYALDPERHLVTVAARLRRADGKVLSDAEVKASTSLKPGWAFATAEDVEANRRAKGPAPVSQKGS